MGKVIEKDLKGADYAKKLIWKTEENFSVKPYYRNEDIEALEYLEQYPNEYPFVRGNKEKPMIGILHKNHGNKSYKS